MKTNTPIFRAKKIDSNEYVQGFYYKDNKDHIIFNGDSTTIFGLRVIDPTTLSIHFPNMNDIKGDKIFASLQEDGKGGDILFDMEYEFTLIFDGLKFRLEGSHYTTEISGYDKFTDFDSIGIQQ